MKVNKQSVFVAGAKSDIATSIARIYAKKGFSLILAARNSGSLSINAEDLYLRGAKSVELVELDIHSLNEISHVIKNLNTLPDIVVCAIGYLGEQLQTQLSPIEAQRVVSTNFTGPAILLEQLAKLMIERGNGTIVGISSVAGDRGRASNYWYGSSKAGFSTFLSGLRQRLHGTGVHVLTVKPGFVKTSMTSKLNIPNWLSASPDHVAKDIVQACLQKKSILYTPWFWRPMMTTIKFIPETMFKIFKL